MNLWVIFKRILMAHTKKNGEMTSEAAHEIANRIVSYFFISMVNFYNNNNSS